MNNRLGAKRRWPMLSRYLAPIGKKSPQTPQNGTAITAEKQDRNGHSSLLDLLNELILQVASFLDLESQLLLSLSCRRLRVLLNSHFDLSLGDDDKATKVRFLQCLELDHPEYLTCRSCGLLYLWRKRELRQYSCPGADRHTMADVRLSCPQFFRAGDTQYAWVGHEVVDLILRAYEHGPDHGLPVSFLNMSGRDRCGVSQTHEARFVNGQLILASRMEVEAGSEREVAEAMHIFTLSMCLHLIYIVGIAGKARTWWAFEQAIARMIVGSVTSEEYKCSFCETDVQVHAKKSERNRIKMVMNVWRNYGRRYGNKLSNEQIFHRDPVVQLNAGTFTQRNIRVAFESKSEGCFKH